MGSPWQCSGWAGVPPLQGPRFSPGQGNKILAWPNKENLQTNKGKSRLKNKSSCEKAYKIQLTVAGEKIHLMNYWVLWASLVAQLVNNLLAMLETWVRSLGWEDPLEKGKATHFSILAWRIPMDRGAWHAAVHGVAKTRTQLSDFYHHEYFYVSYSELR